ncbi:hypothetical protein AB0H51_11615 [Streptomyces griseoluteus]|uniref:hypothetical protein n=1 Tax=Streptomyces griseoluteus TaxID=29306 RepID=UPI0033C166B5
MRKISTALRAAVVTMLVAKRPLLDELPIRWELHPNGISAEPDWKTEPSTVVKIAAEMARAMRGATTGSHVTGEFQVHEVVGQMSGVNVRFYGQYKVTEAAGGESA